MTVVDSSVVVDYLLRGRSATHVAELIAGEREVAAPDIVVFEVLAVLRRMLLRETIEPSTASSAVSDLEVLPLRLFGSMPLRRRAWELRGNMQVADALFVALAEGLAEPLLTGDRKLASAIERTRGIRVEVRTVADPQNG